MTISENVNSSVMGLDIGSRRIGVALSNITALLPQPLTTLLRSEKTLEDIQRLIEEHSVVKIAIGLPRSLDGNITQQTRETLEYINLLKSAIEVPIYEQDEALTSRQAETELIQRAKPYTKADIDALAATYILQDFLDESKVVNNA